MKLKALVTSLPLQQMKEVGVVATQETLHYIECNCTIQWYTILILGILLSGLTLFIITKLRKLKLFRRIFVLKHSQNYVVCIRYKILCTNKIGKTVVDIHFFKITGTLTSESFNLKRNKTWDIMEIDWKEVNVILNGNKINLSKSITI